jgi:hypothetical protein
MEEKGIKETIEAVRGTAMKISSAMGYIEGVGRR